MASQNGELSAREQNLEARERFSDSVKQFYRNKSEDLGLAKKLLLLGVYIDWSAELERIPKENSVLGYIPFSVDGGLIMQSKVLGFSLERLILFDGMKLVMNPPDLNELSPDYSVLAPYVFLDRLDSLIRDLNNQEFADLVSTMIANKASYRDILDVCERVVKEDPTIEEVKENLALMYAAAVVLEPQPAA